MKDYKTLTREKVDVEPGAARYSAPWPRPT